MHTMESSRCVSEKNGRGVPIDVTYSLNCVIWLLRRWM